MGMEASGGYLSGEQMEQSWHGFSGAASCLAASLSWEETQVSGEQPRCVSRFNSE